jgi:O-antigen/teichoic acid export membrane protein
MNNEQLVVDVPQNLPLQENVSTDGRESTRWMRLSALVARFSRGRGAMALADQMMVSASNFATGIVLVRGLGLSEFGKFSIAYALLLYANSLQMSFIASPMLSIAPLLPAKEKHRFVNGMLAIQIMASVLLCVVFALVGAASHLFTKFYSFPCIFVFACCVGTFQLQDWLRRYYFLYNKGKLAFLCDMISYLGQFVLLLALWRLGRLTLTLTFTVMCITSVAALSIGPVTDRLSPAMDALKETWTRCKSLSSSLLISNQIRWFGTQGVLLIGAGIVGSVGIGGLRATSNLSGPVYLMLFSLENYVPMRLAEELKRKGASGAQEFIRRAILGGTVFFALLIAPVGIFGRPILRLVYGPALVAFYLPMLLQLAFIVVAAGTTMWYFLYRSLQDTRAIFRANALSSIVNIGTVYSFGHYWGVSGIVLSSLLSQVALMAYCIFHWTRYREELLRLSSVDGVL